MEGKASAMGRRAKSMMSMESQLPHLPVPPLQQSMDKYLNAVEPLLTEKELKRTTAAVDEFRRPGGMGEKLQSLLQDRAAKTDNWLAEWWDNGAYFDYRAPVVINSSPGILFPVQDFKSDRDQYRYAAKMVHSILQFKDLVDFEQLPVEYAGKDPVTMRQYKKLLSVSRIPQPMRDWEVTTPRDQSRHIIVAHNNHFYKLDCYVEGKEIPLSEEQLIQQFEEIVKDSPDPHPEPVGILTTQNRSVWALAGKRLRRDGRNRDNMNTITAAICLICLDQPVEIPAEEATKYEVKDRSKGLRQVLHGGGSEENSGNRWFDKICQFIVNRNGMVGLCYEHSGAEGPPVMRLCEMIIQNNLSTDTPQTPSTKTLAAPKRLIWRISYDMGDRIDIATARHDDAVEDLELKHFVYDAFGKNVPKKYKMSPDAFFQVCLQLAYFRLHCQIPPTYESGSLRKYAKGRTDVIRSATPAAASFCRAMADKEITDGVKREKFVDAIQAHVQYTKEVMNCEAFDRHLLGLKMTALENGIALPEFFRDKGFGYASHFKLSTSQVPSKFNSALCFGPVVPDGYGVCYNPMETQFNVAISAFNSNPRTIVSDLGECLGEALDDSYRLLASNAHL